MKGMKSVDRRRADCTPLHSPCRDCSTPAVGLELYKPAMQLLLLPLLLLALVAGQKLCLDTETQMAICYTRTAPWGIRRTRLWRSALPSSGWSDLLLYFIPKTLQCQNFIVGPRIFSQNQRIFKNIQNLSTLTLWRPSKRCNPAILRRVGRSYPTG